MVNPLNNFVPRRRKPEPPEDFENTEEFLRHIRKSFADDIEADRKNREQMLEDLRFAAGEQWDSHVVQARTEKGKPSLTINRIPAFINTIIGNRRLTDPAIRVLPDHGGTKEVAAVREGLIRSIQKATKASRAYNKAFENQCISGMGNFQVTLDFADDDVFDQDINIEMIPNALAVVWDRSSVDPTGADAGHVFVVDHIAKSVFKERYPDASTEPLSRDDELIGDNIVTPWMSEDDVRVVSYWRMREEKRLLALVNKVDEATGEVTGDTEVIDISDFTDEDVEEITPRIVLDDDGEPTVRESDRRFAEMYLVTGRDLLEGPYRLPIPRPPVFRAIGWEIHIGNDRRRFGLVRFLRDPQRLHNFWRSVVAQKLMRAPEAVWVASQEAVQGVEDKWRKAHITGDPLLTYNGESGQQPQRVEPAQIETALVNEASMSAQDLRDVSNIHEANLGMEGNEVSGRGIMARQRVGETGMVLYNDNMNEAIEEAGNVINRLIPIVFDQPRTIKVLGVDSEEFDLVHINDVTDDQSIDITSGKYSVSLVTGPSFVTKRIEAAESMLNMVNAMPQTMAVAADKIVEAQDWPGAQEIARRLRTQLPPELVSEDDLTPEMRARIQQQQQAAEQQAQIELARLQSGLDEQRARTQEAIARAAQAEAQAQKALSEVGVQAFEAQTDHANKMFDNRLNLAEFVFRTQRTGENGDG